MTSGVFCGVLVTACSATLWPAGGHIMKRAILLALLLAGCQTTEEQTQARLAREAASDAELKRQIDANDAKFWAEYKAKKTARDQRIDAMVLPSMREYVACNRKAARAVSTQTGDLVSLAVGARGICQSEEAKLRSVVTAAYADEPNGVVSVNSFMESARKKTLDDNAGVIVASRAANNSSPPASPPSGTVR
jgi:hypothetical protein